MADGSVLVHRTMSLDGFIAGPEHEMDWIFAYPSPENVDEVVEATGAIVAGRRTWAVGERDAGTASGAPYGGAWSGPVFVLAHEPFQTGDPNITRVSGDVREVVATAKQAAQGKKVEIFGTDVAAQCFEHGLVDEVLVHVAPVLLGDGVGLYARPGGRRVDLEPVGVTRSRVVTHLHFRVRK